MTKAERPREQLCRQNSSHTGYLRVIVVDLVPPNAIPDALEIRSSMVTEGLRRISCRIVITHKFRLSIR